MDSKTITIELTAKQVEAVKNLEERGLTIGDALERLVEIQDAALKTGDDLLNNKINETEPELASCMVKECIYRGFCPEFNSCGYYITDAFKQELKEYRRGINE